MEKLVLILIALLANGHLFAQQHTDVYYKSNPVWIQMMDDPNVNYYEAVKAFHSFWEGKSKPLQEHELFVAPNEEKAMNNFISNKKNKQTEASNQYSFAYKKFIHWEQRVLPFVKEDGSIMNKDEQLALWRQQRKDRK